MARTPASTDANPSNEPQPGDRPFHDTDDFSDRAGVTRVNPADVNAKAPEVDPANMRDLERFHGERFEKEGVGPFARIARLEKLAFQYFGSHHFEAPTPVFNPDAERDSARARFQQEMERIETAARKPS